MRLDDVLPRYDFGERHAIALDAPPERVFDAIRAVTIGEMSIGRALMKLRGIRASTTEPFLAQALAKSWRVAAEEPGRELAITSIGQPWRVRGGDMRSDDVRGFAEPGYAKMAMNWRYDGEVLSTETRVALTDGRSRGAFRLYWLAIRPFSGLIRRLWLRAAKRQHGIGEHRQLDVLSA